MALTIATSMGLVWIVGYFMLLSDDVVYFTIMNVIFSTAASLQVKRLIMEIDSVYCLKTQASSIVFFSFDLHRI